MEEGAKGHINIFYTCICFNVLGTYENKWTTYFSYIYGLHREKCIMDPLALSYPLTNINIHVQYGSNLIMSFRVKIPRMIILFGVILVNLFLYSGVPKYQRYLSIGDTCTRKTMGNFVHLLLWRIGWTHGINTINSLQRNGTIKVDTHGPNSSDMWKGKFSLKRDLS